MKGISRQLQTVHAEMAYSVSINRPTWEDTLGQWSAMNFWCVLSPPRMIYAAYRPIKVYGIETSVD